jgi:hypothetical protein
MRKTLGIAALMLALHCSVLAGEIPNPPAPQPQSMTVEAPITTDEDTTGATEILTQIALDVALSVLSLL